MSTDSHSVISHWNNLLIVKPTSLGDVVQSLCAVTALKRTFPDRRVSFLVADSCMQILSGHPFIDEVIEFPRTEMKKGSAGMYRAFRSIRRELSSRQFDVVLDLQGLARSGFASYLAKAPVRIGFSDSRELSGLFYTHRIRSDRKSEHAVARYLKAAEYLGALPSIDVSFGLIPFPADVEKIFLRIGSGKLVGIAPGARWNTKRWPVSHFREVAGRLVSEMGMRIVALGAPDEQELSENIVSDLPLGSAVNLCGETTLKELVAAISLCRLFITNDSGPMHIAAALGIPTVSIFGPTSPKRVAPFGQEKYVVTSELPCLGCYMRKCDKISPNCMERVTPGSVYEMSLKAIELAK